MKKLVLLGLTASLLGGCTLVDIADDGKITHRKLTGEWQCTASYPEHNTKTVSRLKLIGDGSLVNNNSIIEPIDKPFFVYDLSSTGTWKFDEQTHKLTYTLTTNSVQRNHTEDALDAMEKDSRYKPYEENLFKKYSKRINKQNTINFTITSLTRDPKNGQYTLVLEQKTAQKSYTSSCVR